MWMALIEIPNNSFYTTHRSELQPILVNAIINWRIANKIERVEQATNDDLTIAFILRSSYADLLTMSATLIGGIEWAVECGPDIRRWAHSEGFTAYLTNLAAEKAVREGAR
jgi:hypothetical protein